VAPAYDDMAPPQQAFDMAPPQQAFEFEQAVQPLDITASFNMSVSRLVFLSRDKCLQVYAFASHFGLRPDK
jgi:hypothetical protein